MNTPKTHDQTKNTGQGLIEYAILLALVALAAILSLTNLGQTIRDGLGSLFADTESGDAELLTVAVVDDDGQGITNVPVYAYSDEGAYVNINQTTDMQGEAQFSLDDGRYRFLAQYQQQWFWSDPANWPGTARVTIKTGQKPFRVTVRDMAGNPIDGVSVHAYVAGDEDAYLGISGETDLNGQTTLGLVDGRVQFRVDYRDQAHWSDEYPTSDGAATITINTCATGSFLAEYFNNRNLSGDPALVQCENEVNYNWGTGAPASGINKNNFSVRWTGSFRFDEATYAISTTADDGVRIWVDDNLIIDAWRPQSATTYNKKQELNGIHVIKMAYFEQGGNAVARLNWRQVVTSCPSGQFLAEYYNNRYLSGDPTITQCESSINYNWGTSAPISGIGSNNFSVRWSGKFTFTEDTYRFQSTADDGVRVWLDDKRLINAWQSHTAMTYTSQQAVSAGEHEVTMEYFEQGGDAVAHLSWDTAVTSCPTGQFLAEYFNNRHLSGDPALTRCETSINNDWETNAPVTGINRDNFSVRWSGQFNFDDEEYEFTARADDGVIVYVDDTRLIYAWRYQRATTYHAEQDMSAGAHEVTMYYFEGGGRAVAQLGWEEK